MISKLFRNIIILRNITIRYFIIYFLIYYKEYKDSKTEVSLDNEKVHL